MATKKAPVKKHVKKSVTKTTASRKAKSSKSVYPIHESFRIVETRPRFFTFKITLQTVYWTFLIAVIIFLQLWILQAQYDAVEVTNAGTAGIETSNR